MSMTEKIWTPGMLCDETTPRDTLVAFCDTGMQGTTGVRRGFRIDESRYDMKFLEPTVDIRWRYAVVVDENGDYPEDVLASEIRRVKGEPEPLTEVSSNSASLVGIAGDHRDQPLYQSILDQIDAHDSTTRGERADRVYADAMRMIGGGV